MGVDATRLVLPARTVAPWRAILIRLSIAVGCIVATTVLTYIERDGYRDLDGTLQGWLGAIYYATVTLSTTGYGDITPVSDAARWTNVLVITPLRFLFLIVLVGTTIEVLTQRSRDQWRQSRWRRIVHDHTVVVGYGVKGRSTVRTLLTQGVPAALIVVVADDPVSIEEATRAGVSAVMGDATREEVLQAARVSTAKRIVVATDRDDTSVLVTLTARRLNPTATLVASVRESQNAAVLRQSGADALVPTAESAGKLLGMSLLSPAAGEMMEDLLDPGAGLELRERPITPAELGLPPHELRANGCLVIAVVRDGKTLRFDTGGVRVLQAGDRVVVIEPSESKLPHPTHHERG